MRTRWRNRIRPEVTATVITAALLVVPIWAARDLILVGDPEERLVLRAVPADLVYGAEQLAQPAPDLGGFEIPDVLAPIFGGVGPAPFRPPAVGPCPTAGPNVFPEEPAGFDISGVVAEGRYLWKQQGEIELATIPLPAAPFSTRTIRNLDRAGDGSFTYEIESTGLLGRRVDRYLVEPGVAISLTGMTIFATDGNRRDFDPVTPVQLLPLPVTIGGTVTGVGIDPVNLRTMIVQGVVQERLRVDACGEIVDAWLVKGTREFRDIDNPTAAPGTFDYAIAPQLGGLFVYDHIVENGTTATQPPLPYSLDITASIGTLDPDPPQEG